MIGRHELRVFARQPLNCLPRPLVHHKLVVHQHHVFLHQHFILRGAVSSNVELVESISGLVAIHLNLVEEHGTRRCILAGISASIRLLLVVVQMSSSCRDCCLGCLLVAEYETTGTLLCQLTSQDGPREPVLETIVVNCLHENVSLALLARRRSLTSLPDHKLGWLRLKFPLLVLVPTLLSRVNLD